MKERMIYQVDDTRNKIIATAEKIFTENGFFETQMKDIASLAEISRNTVYRYFHDKSDLAMVIIEKKITEKAENQLKEIESIREDSSLNGLEKFEKIVTFNWIDSEQGFDSKLMAEFDAYYSGNRISGKMKERFSKLESDEFENMMVSLIDEGKKDGSINGKINSHLTFVTVVNSIRALNQRIILRGDVLVETKGQEINKMLPELMKILINGLSNQRRDK